MAKKIKDKSKLQVKDIIIIGVFSALLLITACAGGGILAATPTLTFFFPIGATVLAGPVFLLLLAKVPKRFAITIAAAIFCILGLVTGMHWGMDFGILISGFLADLIAGTKQYKSVKMNILAFMVYSIGPMGSYFVFFFDTDGWIKTMLANGTTQEYIDTMKATGTVTMMVVMVVGTFVMAAISGFIGSKLLKNQFEKAGITA